MPDHVPVQTQLLLRHSGTTASSLRMDSAIIILDERHSLDKHDMLTCIQVQGTSATFQPTIASRDRVQRIELARRAGFAGYSTPSPLGFETWIVSGTRFVDAYEDDIEQCTATAINSTLNFCTRTVQDLQSWINLHRR